MSSQFQKRVYGTAAVCVVVLAAYGLGEGHGSSSVKTKTVTRTVTHTVTVHDPGKTQTIYRTSPECIKYLADADALTVQFGRFTAAYGGITDQLNLAFDSIESKDEETLNIARIKIANSDRAASDAVSTILTMLAQTQTDKKNCEGK